MLLRKLVRTMGRYRAQFVSMIVMVALGVGVFVGFNIEWYSLERDTAAFFEATGFADYRIVYEGGFSGKDLEAVLAIEGVEDAARFLAVNTTSDGGEDVVALNVAENPAVSGFLLTGGAEYDAASGDGVWLSDRYAAQNGLAPGDSVSFSYKGFSIDGRVAGLVKSGEYLICVPDETQLMPDYATYGYAYISPAMLRRAILVEFYPQINVRSSLGRDEFVSAVERALGPKPLVVPREDTISYAEAMGESEEGKTMAATLPVIFLAIAVLTMVTTMHRLAASEKTQIGTLKSLGFRDGRILRHYSFYALAVGLAGTAAGVGLGWWLGWFIMNPGGPMGTYLDMPDWSLAAPPFVWAALAAVNLLLLLVGFLSVRAMLRGTAADALRPWVPKGMRAVLLERFALWERLNFGARWNLRDAMRHKSRTFMTLFGVAGCMVLLVGALGMRDTMDGFVDVFYNRAILYETRVHLDPEATDGDAAAALAARLDADWCAQSTIRAQGETVGLEIYRVEHDLLRFVDRDMRYVPLGDEGAWVCDRIARSLGLEAGSSFTFSPYGSGETYTARVAGVLRSLTKSVVMSDAYAASIGLEARINVLYTARADVPADSRIVNTQSRQSIIDSFDTFLEIMVMMVALLIAAAVILGVVVLYNLGVMSYAERYREMATLKVIGFQDRRIGRLLIGQNFWLTVVGAAAGLPLGVAVLRGLLLALASEYEMSLVLGWRALAASVLLTFGVSLLVGLLIARRNRRIDMVEALKAPE